MRTLTLLLVVVACGQAHADKTSRRIAYSGVLCAATFYKYEDTVQKVRAGMKKESLSVIPCIEPVVALVAKCFYIYLQPDECMSVQAYVELGLRLSRSR